ASPTRDDGYCSNSTRRLARAKISLRSCSVAAPAATDAAMGSTAKRSWLSERCWAGRALSLLRRQRITVGSKLTQFDDGSTVSPTRGDVLTRHMWSSMRIVSLATVRETSNCYLISVSVNVSPTPINPAAMSEPMESKTGLSKGTRCGSDINGFLPRVFVTLPTG